MKKALKVSSHSILLFALTASFAFASGEKTLANLKKAYWGEIATAQKYASYARSADREGFHDIARLFRATSAAESIHAGNHKAVLEESGVEPSAAGAATAPKRIARQTRNAQRDMFEAVRGLLKDSLRGESHVRDEMYPQMIRTAEEEGQEHAVRSFTYALQAEAQHAALFASALRNLKAPVEGVEYSVCPVCGATFEGRGPTFCPVCGTPRNRFKVIE